MLGIAGHLGSLRVAGVVRRAGRCKDKVAENRPVRGRKEGDKNVRTLAWGNKSRANAIRNSPFVYYRRICFERVPVMDISRGLGHLVRDKKRHMMGGKVAQNVVEGPVEAVTEGIVQQITCVNLNA